MGRHGESSGGAEMLHSEGGDELVRGSQGGSCILIVVILHLRIFRRDFPIDVFHQEPKHVSFRMAR